MTIDKDKYSKYLTAASNSFLSKGWIYLLLVGGLYVLYKAIFRTSLPNFLAFKHGMGENYGYHKQGA